MRKPKRCGNCGSNKIVTLKKGHDTTLPWKDYPSVQVEGDFDGFRCSNCDEIMFSAHQGKLIDDLIKISITRRVNKFISEIIERENCEQRDIAAHLGVSPEYLSEIKSGRKVPKFQTFNFLKTLAFDHRSFEISSPTFNGFKSA